MAKAGILEIADVFVVNKADRDGAGDVSRDLRQMLQLGAARAWDAAGRTTSAAPARGHRGALGGDRRAPGVPGRRPARSADKRRARLLREVESLAAERFRVKAAAALRSDGALADELAARRIDPYRAAAMLMDETAAAT